MDIQKSNKKTTQSWSEWAQDLQKKTCDSLNATIKWAEEEASNYAHYYYPSYYRTSEETTTENIQRDTIARILPIEKNSQEEFELTTRLKSSLEESYKQIQSGSFSSIFSKDFVRNTISFINSEKGQTTFHHGTLASVFSSIELPKQTEACIDIDTQQLTEVKQTEILDIVNQWLNRTPNNEITLKNPSSDQERYLLAIINLAHQGTLGHLNELLSQTLKKQYAPIDTPDTEIKKKNDYVFQLDEKGNIRLSLCITMQRFSSYNHQDFNAMECEIIPCKENSSDTNIYTQSLDITFNLNGNNLPTVTIHDARHTIEYAAREIEEFDITTSGEVLLPLVS